MLFGSNGLRAQNTRLLLTVFIAALATPCGAQIYRWVDDNGVVNYGDQAPRSETVEAIDLPHGPSSKTVELAQQNLQTALQAREVSESLATTSPATSTSPSEQERAAPEYFECYTPIENVLKGPAESAYSPIEPTVVDAALEARIRTILARGDGIWQGSSLELFCTGGESSPSANTRHFTVTSKAHWYNSGGRLLLSNKTSGSNRRATDTEVRYFEVGDAFYYYDTRGDGEDTIERNIKVPGNRSEGLFLDDSSLAFMIKRRQTHIIRTELRLLDIAHSKLRLTELYFRNNLLIGARFWRLKR